VAGIDENNLQVINLRPGGSEWSVETAADDEFGLSASPRRPRPALARTKRTRRVAETELSEMVAGRSKDLGVEYKAWMDTRPHEARANLARHIAALANHGVGYLVFGVDIASRAPMCETTLDRALFSQTCSIGLRGSSGCRGPRIRDVRHTFAVRSLEGCSSAAAAVSRHIVGLSTYLGHAHVTDTYWYLQASPALMTHIGVAGKTLHRGEAQ
jgi:hypothetical protein